MENYWKSHQSKATKFHLGHRVVTFEQLVHVLRSFYSKWAVEQSSRLFTGSIPRVGNTTNLHDDLVYQVQRRSTCNETFERWAPEKSKTAALDGQWVARRLFQWDLKPRRWRRPSGQSGQTRPRIRPLPTRPPPNGGKCWLFLSLLGWLSPPTSPVRVHCFARCTSYRLTIDFFLSCSRSYLRGKRRWPCCRDDITSRIFRLSLMSRTSELRTHLIKIFPFGSITWRDILALLTTECAGTKRNVTYKNGGDADPVRTGRGHRSIPEKWISSVA